MNRKEGNHAPIVVGYDGSESAKGAIEQAGELFGGRPAVVLYAWEAIELSALRRGAIGMSATANEAELDAAAEATARRVAEEGAALARRSGLSAASARAALAEPSAWETLVRAADEEEAAAIVLGSRGLSGLRSFMLGSVSDKVAQHARRPVLIVPSGPLAEARRELSARHADRAPGLT